MPVKKKAKIRQINLVPEEGLSSTTSGRILLWILSTFRMILILTELVVIGAFISRFWLDAKNTDLSEEMRDAKNIIQSLSGFERDFKVVQNTLVMFDTYKENKGKIYTGIKTLVSFKPLGINFKSLTVDMETVNITAQSISEVEIQQYLLNLKSSGAFENIMLSNLSLSKENSIIDFSLSANIKNEI